MFCSASSGMKDRSMNLGVGSLMTARAAMSSGVSQVAVASGGVRARMRPVIMRMRRVRFERNILFEWLCCVMFVVVVCDENRNYRRALLLIYRL